MSQVKLLVAMALTAVATGAASVGIEAVITDAAGARQSKVVLVGDFPTPAADGTFTVEIDFDGVASGSFSGSVTANDQLAAPVAPGVAFSGTASNLQAIPVSVNIAFA